MYKFVPEKPYDTFKAKTDRDLFLEAVKEMDRDVQIFIEDWIEQLKIRIMKKQDKRFRNPQIAYNDAVLAVSRVVWIIPPHPQPKG